MSADPSRLDYKSIKEMCLDEPRWIYENAERIGKSRKPKILQEELAKAIGVSSRTWRTRRINATEASKADINTICKLLKCAPEQLKEPPANFYEMYIRANTSNDTPGMGEMKQHVLINAFNHLDEDEQRNVLDIVIKLWERHEVSQQKMSS